MRGRHLEVQGTGWKIDARNVMSKSLNHRGNGQDPEQWLAKEAEVRCRWFDRRAGREPRPNTRCAGAGRDDDADGPSNDSCPEAEFLEALCEDRGKNCAKESTHPTSLRMLAAAMKHNCHSTYMIPYARLFFLSNHSDM